MISIQLPARVHTVIGGIGITDAMLATLLATVLIIGFSLWFSRKIQRVPGKSQLALEMLYDFWHTQAVNAFGSEKVAAKIVPLFLTLFILLVIANQFSFIPLSGALLFNDHPLFRTPTSDLSHTVALALIMLGFTHIIALLAHPLQHIGNYIKIAPLVKARSLGEVGNALLEIFLGLLDIIGEGAKILSLSGRLFGNLFAGDVMILVIASLAAATAYIVPIPFIFLSLFSGFVQATVFTMLTLLFLAGTSSQHLKERLDH